MANSKADGSKGDTVVKLVLVFFISLLSFSIGTFIGKKFSDNQHQLAELEPGEKSSRDVASVHSSDVKPESALKEEDIAKLAEEFVTDDEEEPGKKAEGEHGHEAKHEGKDESHGKKEDAHHAVAKSGHGEEEHAAAPSKGHGAENEHGEQPQKAAQRVAEGKAPAEEHHGKAVGSRIPNSLPAAVSQSSIGKYTVQIASYPQEEDAKKMAEDLRKRGFAANYVQAFAKGQNWYRVVVGLFSTAEEAQKYRNDLLAKASVSSAIIQKISK